MNKALVRHHKSLRHHERIELAMIFTASVLISMVWVGFAVAEVVVSNII